MFIINPKGDGAINMNNIVRIWKAPNQECLYLQEFNCDEDSAWIWEYKDAQTCHLCFKEMIQFINNDCKCSLKED